MANTWDIVAIIPIRMRGCWELALEGKVVKVGQGQVYSLCLAQNKTDLTGDPVPLLTSYIPAGGATS